MLVACTFSICLVRSLQTYKLSSCQWTRTANDPEKLSISMKLHIQLGYCWLKHTYTHMHMYVYTSFCQSAKLCSCVTASFCSIWKWFSRVLHWDDEDGVRAQRTHFYFSSKEIVSKLFFIWFKEKKLIKSIKFSMYCVAWKLALSFSRFIFFK